MMRLIRRAIHMGALFISVVCVMSIAILFARSIISERTYENLRAASLFDASSRAGQPDSAPQDAITEHIAAWLEVEGTHISYPVVQPAANLPRDWYLSHNVWGEWDPLGCPYLDRRCDLTGQHLMVFGHHMQGTDQMFSELSETRQQEVFDSIGAATWDTRNGTATTFDPLFALSVDASDSEIQRFTFANEGEMRSWLISLSKRAEATSPDAETLIERAARVLTLVTCSEAQAGGRTRTLTVFVSPDTASR